MVLPPWRQTGRWLSRHYKSFHRYSRAKQPKFSSRVFDVLLTTPNFSSLTWFTVYWFLLTANWMSCFLAVLHNWSADPDNFHIDPNFKKHRITSLTLNLIYSGTPASVTPSHQRRTSSLCFSHLSLLPTALYCHVVDLDLPLSCAFTNAVNEVHLNELIGNGEVVNTEFRSCYFRVKWPSFTRLGSE